MQDWVWGRRGVCPLVSIMCTLSACCSSTRIMCTHTDTQNNLCAYCTYLAYLLCSLKAPAANPSLSFSLPDNRPSNPLLFFLLFLFCSSCQWIDMEMPRTWYWNMYIYTCICTQTVVHMYVCAYFQWQPNGIAYIDRHCIHCNYKRITLGLFSLRAQQTLGKNQF